MGLDNYRAIGFSKELSKYHPKLLVFIAHGATLFPIGRLDQLKKADEDEKKEAEAAAKKKQEEEGKKKKEAEKKKSKAADASKAAAAAPAVVEQPKTICFRQHLASDVPFDELKIPAPPAGVTPTWKFYVSFGAPCEGVVAVGEIPCDQLEYVSIANCNGVLSLRVVAASFPLCLLWGKMRGSIVSHIHYARAHIASQHRSEECHRSERQGRRPRDLQPSAQAVHERWRLGEHIQGGRRSFDV